MSKIKQEKLADSSSIFMSCIVDKLVISLLVFVTLLSGFILSSTHAKADDVGNSVVDEVIAIVPAACSLSGTIASGKEHTATIIAGSYSENIGTTNLKAICNDFSGFSIYAAGFTGNTFSSGNTNMVGANTNQTIPTGTATSGDTSNWAMKLTKVTNPATGNPITYNPQNLTIITGYDDYHAIPSSLTKVVNYEAASGSSTTDSILGANVETTYRIFMSPSQDSDTYNGKVKYILVHPATLVAGTYSITYNANGGTGTMNQETNLPNYEPHTLPASTLTPPSGYALAGWCTVQDATASGVVQGADPQTTCTGTSYPKNGTIPASTVDANGTFNLYAYWKVPTLYDNIATMSKGTQTLAQLQETITVPTSADRTQDTSNSGVYEYNSSVFGTASDAANTSTIYYYRGVLEDETSTYGSDGSAVTYPNYVILDANGTKDTSDTCWRIVRTTGSGGVKMIYNGKWTGSTCANNTTAAQVTTKAFNSSYNSAVYVGYTYNSNMANSTNTESVDDVFGSNGHPEYNNTRSTIKAYIEDTWYADNMTAYTSILEPNAGYCNDRTVYDTSGNLLSEIVPQQSVQVNFGSYTRNLVNNASGPTLRCPRGDVDIYRYIDGNQTSYTSNKLKYPVALLTADESALAGSGGSSGNPTTYSGSSYLHSGSYFWLLSPRHRDSNGRANGFRLNSNGTLGSGYVYNSFGVRPTISLQPGTTTASGTGIATDPWVVTAP